LSGPGREGPEVFAPEFHRRMGLAKDSRRWPLLTAGEAETIATLLSRLKDALPEGDDTGVFATELALMLTTRVEELGDIGHWV
jgi:hypothetical protein